MLFTGNIWKVSITPYLNVEQFSKSEIQLREKHGKPSVRVAKEIQSTLYTNKTPTHYKTHPYTHTHPHITKQFKTTTVQIETNTVQDIPK
jgi:hypothetical protein